MKSKEKINKQQPEAQQETVVRKSKIALAMEELRGNPAIRILDMRAVLR